MDRGERHRPTSGDRGSAGGRRNRQRLGRSGSPGDPARRSGAPGPRTAADRSGRTRHGRGRHRGAGAVTLGDPAGRRADPARRQFAALGGAPAPPGPARGSGGEAGGRHFRGIRQSDPDHSQPDRPARPAARRLFAGPDRARGDPGGRPRSRAGHRETGRPGSAPGGPARDREPERHPAPDVEADRDSGGLARGHGRPAGTRSGAHQGRFFAD